MKMIKKVSNVVLIILSLVNLVLGILSQWDTAIPKLKIFNFTIEHFKILAPFIKWHSILNYGSIIFALAGLIVVYQAIKRHLLRQENLFWLFFSLATMTIMCSLLSYASDSSTTLAGFCFYGLTSAFVGYFGVKTSILSFYVQE